MGKILVFVSASGGQGRTSSALGVAAALRKRGRSVLLVDGCSDGALTAALPESESALYDFGDAARYYTRSPFHGEAEAAQCSLSEAAYDCCGVKLVAAPADDSGVGAQSIRALLEAAADECDYCILDCPARSYSDLAYICGAADVTVLCATARPEALRAAAKLRRLLPEDDERVRLLLTRYSVPGVKSGELAGIDEAIDTAETRLLGVFSEGMLPWSVKDEKTACSGQADNAAARLEGERVPLAKLR